MNDIRLLVLDVDGVLTDGKLYYGPSGEVAKSFHVQDGYGLRKLMHAGIQVAIISGRPSDGAAIRFRELEIEHVFLACKAKRDTLTSLQSKLGITPEQTAVIGDDLPDLEMMACAGLSIAVANAHPTVRARVDVITRHNGGEGAVREVCDAILYGAPDFPLFEPPSQ
ncbi:MAG: HAD-IIIA family hydrolase [Pseudomonadota bacterium]